MNFTLQTLFYLSLSGTALGFLLLALRWIFKNRLPSAFYYYAWLLVLLRFIIPLPGLMPMSGSQAQSISQAAPLTTVSQEWTARPYLEADIPSNSEQKEKTTGQYTGTEDSGPVVAAAPASEDSAENETPLTARDILAYIRALVVSTGFWITVWALGASLSAAKHIIGYRLFAHSLRKLLLSPHWEDMEVYYTFPLKKRPILARCRCIRTPMLLGLSRPIIVLPDRDYSIGTLKNILRHEVTHYQRGDIIFKWFAVLVFSLHWFNPLTILFLRELDRDCELSCDEHLLRHMTAGEKQNYGETLLNLAADRSLPHSVVATTFATEKRTLKERLMQIMTYKHRGKTSLALALVVLLAICACGAAMGPKLANQAKAPDTSAEQQLTPEPTSETVPVSTLTTKTASAGGEVTVSTVDELLAAIAPDTTVYLEPGTYDLSQASDYGTAHDGGWYTWESVYDGYELVIIGVENFSLLGAEAQSVTISAVPRYADVLAFRDCNSIILSGLTAGHTVEPGVCMGGVIDLVSTNIVDIDGCRLYGCGILGITANNCRQVYAHNTDIYECSLGAVSTSSSYDVRVEKCSIYDCGQKEFGTSPLFNFDSTYGAAVINCQVYNNNAMYLLRSAYSQEVYYLGNNTENNTFTAALIQAKTYSPVVDNCVFTSNEYPKLYGDMYDSATSFEPAVSLNGTVLDSDSGFTSMTLAEAVYDGPAASAAPELKKTITSDGMTEVTVSTVDELLAAIAPNTTVYLAPGDYDLSRAANYGAYGGQYYYWVSLFDGPGLVITGVENFHIIGAGTEESRILAVPRYSEVILFSQCKNISVTALTAGHTQAPGTCSGGVLKFRNSSDIQVAQCGLFGCGILGVTAIDCANIEVLDTEIYECSNGAASIENSQNVAFENCDIHDCGTPLFHINGSTNITLDGEPLTSSY